MSDAYEPIIRNGEVLAGGITIATVDDEGRIIFEDRYERRCVARGSNNVPVRLVDLMAVILEHYRLDIPGNV